MKKNAQHLFPSDLLDRLKSLGEVQHFEAGEVLIQESEASTHLYILLSGELKVFTSNRSGRQLTYNTLKPGDYFGELSLDGRPRSASVRAITACECLMITEDVVRGLVKTEPDFVFHLIVKLIDHVRRSTKKLKSVALDDIYERIVALIEEEAVIDNGICHLPRTLIQQEIANRIGASREMVNHVFRDLVREGFLEKDPEFGFLIRKSLSRH